MVIPRGSWSWLSLQCLHPPPRRLHPRPALLPRLRGGLPAHLHTPLHPRPAFPRRPPADQRELGRLHHRPTPRPFGLLRDRTNAVAIRLRARSVPSGRLVPRSLYVRLRHPLAVPSPVAPGPPHLHGVALAASKQAARRGLPIGSGDYHSPNCANSSHLHTTIRPSPRF